MSEQEFDDSIEAIIASISFGEIQTDVMRKHFNPFLHFEPKEFKDKSVLSSVFPELN